jgi:hypothetical protein
MIFDTIDHSIKFCQHMTKSYRKNIWTFAGMIFLNLILVAVNIPLDSMINKLAIGALSMNCLWQLFFLWDSIIDYQHNREMLEIFKKHDIHKEYQQTKKSYESAKEYYESLTP